MKGIPRLKVDATNPPRSVMTPPPRLISNERREAPLPASTFQRCSADFKDLFFSPAGISSTSAGCKDGTTDVKRSRQQDRVFVSVRMKTESVPDDRFPRNTFSS